VFMNSIIPELIIFMPTKQQKD